MKAFAARSALRLNFALRRRNRRGRVWGSRYHRHDLKTPREVRNALVYVLANYKKHPPLPKHERGLSRIDPYSSAPWFDGWTSHRRNPPDTPRPGARPLTFLLRKKWQARGLIHPGEAPKTPPSGERARA